ncbi:MAG TPA: succinylglutamate desuccinylase/aspartoacylase family protein [Candidatus Ventrimonas merdavium]|nr:succinylglutamate desuccinylase/aspartoacylase family protein [Candidatus Ventrimonas merdavium]
MIFCETTILPGERRNVQIPVPDAPPLEAVCLCGADLGRTLVVTAGVHGCEYVGIQALRRLARELDPAALTGNVILLPLANPTAFYAGAKQVVPEDGVNLNRAFPGDRKGSLSARLAFALEEALYPAADLLADLHGGDCSEALQPLVFFPTAGEEAVNRASQAAAKALTVPYRVRSAARNGLYSWAVQKRIPALLIERGEKGLWSEQEVDACCEDVRSLMRHLNILPGGNPPRDQTEIVEAFYAEAESEGFWYPAAGFSQQVRKGELLGHLETLSGSRLQEVRAECDGIVLYYTVALGVRAGDPLIAYGHP